MLERKRIEKRDFNDYSATPIVKGEYNVKLIFEGSNKIQLIKELNEIMYTLYGKSDLAKAKSIADNCPTYVATEITDQEAQYIKSKLESFGAVVEVDKSGQCCEIQTVKTIDITRRKQFSGGGSKIKMYIDGNYYTNLESGDTVKLKQNAGRYMSFCFVAGDGNHWSENYPFPSDEQCHKYEVFTKSRLFSVAVLLEEM